MLSGSNTRFVTRTRTL